MADKEKQDSKSRGTKLTLGSLKDNIKSKLGYSDSGSGKASVTVQHKRKKITIPKKIEDNTSNSSKDLDKKTSLLKGLTTAEKNKRLEVLKNAEEYKTKLEQEKLKREQERENQTKQDKEKPAINPETKNINNIEEKKDVSTKAATEKKDKSKITLNKKDEEPKNITPKVYKAESLTQKPAVYEEPEYKEKEAPKKAKSYEDRRATNKLSISKVLSIIDDDGDGTGGRRKGRSLASIRRAQEKAKRNNPNYAKNTEKVYREVIIPEFITVQELSNRMTERGSDVIKSLMKMGMMVTINQTIDADTAELVVSEMGHVPKRVQESDIENLLTEKSDDSTTQEPRAPVVTIMGHVDHGKTSLLDALRATDVVSGEAGGITQHIGAYKVHLSNDKSITFLDTPGHEAFTAMRMRGANATDIVVLVVAADDGIMEQTIEAINHSKAANVPIIVAINKIDKPDSDPNRVKTELLNHELIPEDMGGNVMTIEVSAKQKKGLSDLEEAILLQAEMLELKAAKKGKSAGVVIESVLDKGRGPIATLLVQKGILQIGNLVVCGTAYGKVRALLDDKGQNITTAGPSTPVEVIGLDSVPNAGDTFTIADSEKMAKQVTDYRKKKEFEQKVATHATQNTLESLFSRAKDGFKELNIIVKADTKGSIEAISSSLEKLSDEQVRVKVLHSAVGAISDSDVTLANASKAIIIGFNVRATQSAKSEIEKNKIKLSYYSIIYNIIDDIKAIMNGLLDPVMREKYLGTAEVRNVFNVKGIKIAGCYVLDGIIKRGGGLRILRDNVVIHEGKLKTLKRFKDDTKEVATNYECGIAIENYQDIKEKDKIEVFELVQE